MFTETEFVGTLPRCFRRLNIIESSTCCEGVCAVVRAVGNGFTEELSALPAPSVIPGAALFA